MSHRARRPRQRILATIITEKGDRWNDATRDVARSDAERVLEAMIAEHGVDNAVQALDNQGLSGAAYRYLLDPLFAEATRRRLAAHQDPDEPLRDA